MLMEHLLCCMLLHMLLHIWYLMLLMNVALLCSIIILLHMSFMYVTHFAHVRM